MQDNEFIIALLKQKESEQLAFFPHFDFERIGETVCALLNTNGGRIIVGCDRHGKLTLIENFEAQYNELRRYTYEKIIPESLIGIRKESYQDGEVVLIEVIEGNKKPYTINNRTFVREGVETKVADDNDMSNLIRSRRRYEYSWERSPVLEASIEDLDLEEISKAIELSNRMERSSKFKPDEHLKFLTHFQLFRNNQLTNASIVLFAKEPTYFLPQCRIRIIEFGKGKTSDRFENTVIIESNLFKAFREVQTYFKKHLPIVSEFRDDDWQRRDRLKYPPKALDEAVINSIMHRDYSDVTGEVFIGIYSDKIEVINSGELPAPLKDKDLKKSHRSIPPNPGITHIVYLCGMIEKVGRGTILITEQFEELGLEQPLWISKNGATTLILHGVPKKQKEVILNERMHRFLEHLQAEASFTREDYEKFFKGEISEKTARNDIAGLLDSRWVKRVGKAASTKYVKLNKALPDIAGGR